METKYNAIIVDPDLETRARLHQAAHAMRGFGRVVNLNSMLEAIDRLNAEEQFDVIFIAHQFDKAEIDQFIPQAKKTKHGDACAYIMVLKPDQQDTATVAQNVMEGVDGFLFEPYSVDALHNITEIASRVKHECAQKRMSKATEFMIANLMQEIDARAFDKASGKEPEPYTKDLKKTKKTLGNFASQNESTFLDIASGMMDNAQPRPNVDYAGPSARVKTMLERKAKEELKQSAIQAAQQYQESKSEPE